MPEMLITAQYAAVTSRNNIPKTARDVIVNFGLIGFYSFGGTGANIGLARELLVENGYVSNADFAEIFALANCLPGPTVAQVVQLGVEKG